MFLGIFNHFNTTLNLDDCFFQVMTENICFLISQKKFMKRISNIEFRIVQSDFKPSWFKKSTYQGWSDIFPPTLLFQPGFDICKPKSDTAFGWLPAD